MGLRLQSMAIEMPTVARHPNRMPFAGVLTFIDMPSDKAPSGARGHRVLLTKEATDRALPLCWEWRWITRRRWIVMMRAGRWG